MLETLPTVQRTTVAGIPAWWAPADGPVTAALTFRTGYADETLATAGITHLVEHLALFPLGRCDYTYNGCVESDRCTFYASGTLDEVRGFLRDLTAALSDLPLDRLQTERRLLRTEAAQREGNALVARLLSLRFGAAGFGLVAFEELGLLSVGPEAVAAWAAERFTRENAVLWMTAEPPDDLELTLPAGRRLAAPEPRPLTLTFPAAVAEGAGAVALSGLAPRTIALRVAAGAVSERLVERLRRDRGLAYSPFATVDGLDVASAHLVLAADCLQEHAATVRDELWRVAGEIAEHGASEEEVARIHADMRRSYEHADALRGELDGAAYDDLLGRERVGAAGMLERIAAVDGAASAGALAAALEAPIFLVPHATPAPDGFVWREPQERYPVTGTHYQPPRSGLLRRRPMAELVVGADGLTYRGGGETVTVRWEDCVAAERRLDGSMSFFRQDEGWFELVPGSWEDGDAALEQALERLPPELLITEIDVELFDRLMAVGAADLPERAELSTELGALVRELRVDETPELLVAAGTITLPGLLAVTDQRLIWLQESSDGLEQRIWSWTSPIEIAGSSGVIDVIEQGQRTGRLMIDPRSRAKEVEDLIARHIAAAA